MCYLIHVIDLYHFGCTPRLCHLLELHNADIFQKVAGYTLAGEGLSMAFFTWLECEEFYETFTPQAK